MHPHLYTVAPLSDLWDWPYGIESLANQQTPNQRKHVYRYIDTHIYIYIYIDRQIYIYIYIYALVAVALPLITTPSLIRLTTCAFYLAFVNRSPIAAGPLGFASPTCHRGRRCFCFVGIKTNIMAAGAFLSLLAAGAFLLLLIGSPHVFPLLPVEPVNVYLCTSWYLPACIFFFSRLSPVLDYRSF